ncbi:hypothetical protein MMC28_002117 [Mycoblastus sanguinarius]|nr:hypothetical protein [Mycoblastus sanguinarius]
MPNPPPKKKSSFFSGLFSVKEPSAQAFANYERQLLKQGNGRVAAVGLPGVSSAKLPPTVPKVNSKWDGIPQTLKEKEKQKDMTKRNSISGLSRHVSTARSEGSGESSISIPRSRGSHSRGTVGGTSSHGGGSSRNNLSELYGWERPSQSCGSLSKDFATEHRPATSRSTSSSSAPPLQPTSTFPRHSAPQHPPQPLSIPKTYRNQSPPSLPSLPSLSYSPSLPSHSNSPSLTPCDPSPVTPDALWSLGNAAKPDIDQSMQDNLKVTVLEAPTSTDEVIVKSAGINILGPPAAAKRKPKPSPFQSGERRPNTAGADYQLNPIPKKEAIAQKDTLVPRRSPSSYFASPRSGDTGAPARHNSARDRLGLGMSSKHQLIAPWLSQEPGSEAVAEVERIITPTPEAGHSLRRKRRKSLFKK